jgi:hypothetical protein
MKLNLGLAAVAVAALASTPGWAKKQDDVEIGAAFIDTCVSPAPDRAAVRARIAAEPAWVSTPFPSDFGFAKKSRPAGKTAWTRTIDGHEVLLVLLEDDPSVELKNSCAFIVRDERSAMWYFRSVSDKLKAFGLKLKEQDIPHYRLHRGKFANGQRGEAILRSKSAALPGKDLLHLEIAF